MKFRYIGKESAPGSGRTVVCGSIDVAVGGEFDCPADLVDRLTRHPFFEAVVAKVEAPPPPKEETPPPAADRASLIEEAERRGIEIDKRWSTGRIQQHLEGVK